MEGERKIEKGRERGINNDNLNTQKGLSGLVETSIFIKKKGRKVGKIEKKKEIHLIFLLEYFRG
jgi:hypothetical protein